MVYSSLRPQDGDNHPCSFFMSSQRQARKMRIQGITHESKLKQKKGDLGY